MVLMAAAGMRRSIIKQSYDARERKMDENLPSHLQLGNLNGDGCARASLACLPLATQQALLHAFTQDCSMHAGTQRTWC